MGTVNKTLDINGDKKYQQTAKKILPILVRQAQARKTIFYSDLANEINMPNPRNLNYPLGAIGKTLIQIGEQWNEEIPQIQFLVINKHTALPGEGINEFFDDNSLKQYNSQDKKKFIELILANIYKYDKWDLILKKLNLNSAPISQNVIQKINFLSKIYYKGGGEGQEHKDLKNYIKNNPHVISKNLIKMHSELEKKLPSGDSIDVFFENDKNWIGVEVKSKISDENDILRGLFQCIKYQAVLEAWSYIYKKNKEVKIILALGGKFPTNLIPIKNSLGIKVIEVIR